VTTQLHPCFEDIAQRASRVNKGLKEGALKPEDTRFVREGYAYLYKDGGNGLAVPMLAVGRSGGYYPQGDNDNDSYIEFVVTREVVDRDGDLVLVAGRDGTDYANSPAWFWGHQKWDIPIGTSRSPQGQIAVFPEGDQIRQGCYFDKSDEDAMFLHGKVKRGIINATSIAFIPIEAYRMEDLANAGHQVPESRLNLPLQWLFKRWSHTETSLVGIGSNPHALRDSLDREKGYITPKLYKHMLPYAAITKGCWNGWCLSPCVPEEPKHNTAAQTRPVRPVSKAASTCACKSCSQGKPCPCTRSKTQHKKTAHSHSPLRVRYKGIPYAYAGVTGKRKSDGTPVRKYLSLAGAAIWLTQKGRVLKTRADSGSSDFHLLLDEHGVNQETTKPEPPNREDSTLPPRPRSPEHEENVRPLSRVSWLNYNTLIDTLKATFDLGAHFSWSFDARHGGLKLRGVPTRLIRSVQDWFKRQHYQALLRPTHIEVKSLQAKRAPVTKYRSEYTGWLIGDEHVPLDDELHISALMRHPRGGTFRHPIEAVTQGFVRIHYNGNDKLYFELTQDRVSAARQWALSSLDPRKVKRLFFEVFDPATLAIVRSWDEKFDPRAEEDFSEGFSLKGKRHRGRVRKNTREFTAEEWWNNASPEERRDALTVCGHLQEPDAEWYVSMLFSDLDEDTRRYLEWGFDPKSGTCQMMWHDPHDREPDLAWSHWPERWGPSPKLKSKRPYPPLPANLAEHMRPPDWSREQALQTMESSWITPLPPEHREEARLYANQFLDGDLSALLALSDLLKEVLPNQEADPNSFAHVAASHAARILYEHLVRHPEYSTYRGRARTGNPLRRYEEANYPEDVYRLINDYMLHGDQHGPGVPVERSYSKGIGAPRDYWPRADWHHILYGYPDDTSLHSFSRALNHLRFEHADQTVRQMAQVAYDSQDPHDLVPILDYLNDLGEDGSMVYGTIQEALRQAVVPHREHPGQGYEDWYYPYMEELEQQHYRDQGYNFTSRFGPNSPYRDENDQPRDLPLEVMLENNRRVRQSTIADYLASGHTHPQDQPINEWAEMMNETGTQPDWSFLDEEEKSHNTGRLTPSAWFIAKGTVEDCRDQIIFQAATLGYSAQESEQLADWGHRVVLQAYASGSPSQGEEMAQEALQNVMEQIGEKAPEKEEEPEEAPELGGEGEGGEELDLSGEGEGGEGEENEPSIDLSGEEGEEGGVELDLGGEEENQAKSLGFRVVLKKITGNERQDGSKLLDDEQMDLLQKWNDRIKDAIKRAGVGNHLKLGVVKVTPSRATFRVMGRTEPTGEGDNMDEAVTKADVDVTDLIWALKQGDNAFQVTRGDGEWRGQKVTEITLKATTPVWTRKPENTLNEAYDAVFNQEEPEEEEENPNSYQSLLNGIAHMAQAVVTGEVGDDQQLADAGTEEARWDIVIGRLQERLKAGDIDQKQYDDLESKLIEQIDAVPHQQEEEPAEEEGVPELDDSAQKDRSPMYQYIADNMDTYVDAVVNGIEGSLHYSPDRSKQDRLDAMDGAIGSYIGVKDGNGISEWEYNDLVNRLHNELLGMLGKSEKEPKEEEPEEAPAQSAVNQGPRSFGGTVRVSQTGEPEWEENKSFFTFSNLRVSPVLKGPQKRKKTEQEQSGESWARTLRDAMRRAGLEWDKGRNSANFNGSKDEAVVTISGVDRDWVNSLSGQLESDGYITEITPLDAETHQITIRSPREEELQGQEQEQGTDWQRVIRGAIQEGGLEWDRKSMKFNVKQSNDTRAVITFSGVGEDFMYGIAEALENHDYQVNIKGYALVIQSPEDSLSPEDEPAPTEPEAPPDEGKVLYDRSSGEETQVALRQDKNGRYFLHVNGTDESERYRDKKTAEQAVRSRYSTKPAGKMKRDRYTDEDFRDNKWQSRVLDSKGKPHQALITWNGKYWDVTVDDKSIGLTNSMEEGKELLGDRKYRLDKRSDKEREQGDERQSHGRLWRTFEGLGRGAYNLVTGRKLGEGTGRQARGPNNALPRSPRAGAGKPTGGQLAAENLGRGQGRAEAPPPKKKKVLGDPTQADIENPYRLPVFLAPGVREREPLVNRQRLFHQGSPVQVEVYRNPNGVCVAKLDGAPVDGTFDNVRDVWEALRLQGYTRH
jgi:hypothetical protein